MLEFESVFYVVALMVVAIAIKEANIVNIAINFLESIFLLYYIKFYYFINIFFE